MTPSRRNHFPICAYFPHSLHPVRVIPPQRYAPHVSAPMLCPRPAPQSGDCVRGRLLRLGASPLRCVPLRRRNSARCSTAHGRPLVRLVVVAAPHPARRRRLRTRMHAAWLGRNTSRRHPARLRGASAVPRGPGRLSPPRRPARPVRYRTCRPFTVRAKRPHLPGTGNRL
jgi:hypothetical protein